MTLTSGERKGRGLRISEKKPRFVKKHGGKRKNRRSGSGVLGVKGQGCYTPPKNWRSVMDRKVARSRRGAKSIVENRGGGAVKKGGE